jgi:hypothetical protein
VGILANKRLRRKLAPFGYHKSTNTPGLWRHESRPLTFTLVVNNFGVKFVNKANVNHLIASIKKTYTLTEDWTGGLYCGITLEWNYVGCTVDISMPEYIKMKLQEYKHIMLKKLQTCPYLPESKKFGTEAQAPLPHDSTPKLDKNGIKRVQTIVGSILYYARAVDMTVLIALSSIAVEQMKAMEKNNGTMHPIIGLPVGPCRRKGPIPRIGHDLKYPLGCLLFFGSKCPQLCMRSFFHGVDAKGWQIHSNKWSFLCQHDNFAFRRCIRRQGRFGRYLPQLPDGDYFLTHPHRNGSPATKNPHPLQQRHGGGHCKQYNQKTALAINRNEIFLDWG